MTKGILVKRALGFASAVAALAFSGLVSMTSTASATVFDAVARGTDSSSGGNCGCYPVGFDTNGAREYRGYFGFDLTSLSGATIYGATLAILEPNNPGDGYGGPPSGLTLTIGGYSGVFNQLSSASGTVFNELGTGTVFGSVLTTAADNGTQVLITLNSAGISAITAAEGGDIAFGGYLTGAGAGGYNTLFQWSGYAQGQAPAAVTLTLDTVPEPASMALFGVGVAGLGWMRRRRPA